MSNTENKIAKILKYLSMKYRIGSPNFHMSAPNNKNLEVNLKSNGFSISSYHYSPFEGLLGNLFASQKIYVLNKIE